MLVNRLFALSREAAELVGKALSAKPLSRGNQVNRRLIMNLTLLFVLRFGTSPGSRRSCFPVSQYLGRFRPQKNARCASVGIERSGDRDYGRVNRLEITPFPSLAGIGRQQGRYNVYSSWGKSCVDLPLLIGLVSPGGQRRLPPTLSKCSRSAFHFARVGEILRSCTPFTLLVMLLYL